MTSVCAMTMPCICQNSIGGDLGEWFWGWGQWSENWDLKSEGCRALTSDPRFSPEVWALNSMNGILCPYLVSKVRNLNSKPFRLCQTIPPDTLRAGGLQR
jgi:hypothetical protein